MEPSHINESEYTFNRKVDKSDTAKVEKVDTPEEKALRIFKRKYSCDKCGLKYDSNHTSKDETLEAICPKLPFEDRELRCSPCKCKCVVCDISRTDNPNLRISENLTVCLDCVKCSKCRNHTRLDNRDWTWEHGKDFICGFCK